MASATAARPGLMGQIFKGSRVGLTMGSGTFYNPRTDTVNVGPTASGPNVLLHELGHATGHRSRTGRLDLYARGREFAREEIVAELIGYRVAKRLGIPRDHKRSRRIVGDFSRDNQSWKTADGRGYSSEAFGRGGRYGGRSRKDAELIMRDVRQGENLVMAWSRRGALARARPQVGGGN